MNSVGFHTIQYVSMCVCMCDIMVRNVGYGARPPDSQSWLHSCGVLDKLPNHPMPQLLHLSSEANKSTCGIEFFKD